MKFFNGYQKKPEKKDDEIIVTPEQKRDYAICQHIANTHKKCTRIKVNDDNNLVIDKLCWDFYSGIHYFKPIAGPNGVEFVPFTEDEVAKCKSKINKLTAMAKDFSAKMMDGDVEAAVIQYPDNKDFMDEQMAAFLNTLSRVLWREKRFALAGIAAAKDGCITGKGNIGVTVYKDDDGNIDFDIEYFTSLEVFSGYNCKYRRYSVHKDEIEDKYGKEIFADSDDQENNLYDKGTGNVTVWDFYSKKIEDVPEGFRAIVCGATPTKVLHYEKYDEKEFPLFTSGFNIVGNDYTRGRGYFRDTLGIQLSINAAHSVIQTKIDNFKMFMLTHKDSKIQVDESGNYTNLFYEGNVPPREFQHSTIPQEILNYPEQQSMEMMDVSGIKDQNYVPQNYKRVAVGAMNVIVQSEKRRFTEDIMHFSQLIADVTRYAFRMVQKHYSKERIQDMVGSEYIPAIDRFKDEKKFNVYKNYDFTVTLGTGFDDSMTLTSQDLSMLKTNGIVSAKEAKAYLQKRGVLDKSPFGAIQAEGKAKYNLNLILDAKHPDQLNDAGLSAYDDFETHISIFEDFARTYRYSYMKELDENGNERVPNGLAKAVAIDNYIANCKEKFKKQKIEEMQFNAQLTAAQQAINSAIQPPQPPPQGQGPGGAQPGNPFQMNPNAQEVAQQ